MKNRRNRKLAREEWGQPAEALAGRPQAETQPEAQPESSAKPRYPKLSASFQDHAHDVWLKEAQAIVDRFASITDEAPMARPAYAALAEKPGRGEWMKWAGVVVDRLTTCVHVYSKPPHADVFMADKERQEKNGRALDLLRRIHALSDDADTPTDSLTELEHHDERVMSGLRVLLEETLRDLPGLSLDMQKLLKSPWLENCNGRVADELFRGPAGHEAEGIGSGHVEHGRLAESLHELLEREKIGEGRHPREELRAPHQATHWQDELPRRWSRHNTSSLRSAGRVE